MTPEIVLQKAIRARLTGAAAVTSLVPAASILDRNERPVPMPSIIIGEGQTTYQVDNLKRQISTVFMDCHVWKKEPSTAGVKAIAGEVRRVLHSGRLMLDPGFHCIDAHVISMRFLRDPDGETSHAIVTVQGKVQEVADA